MLKIFSHFPISLEKSFHCLSCACYKNSLIRPPKFNQLTLLNLTKSLKMRGCAIVKIKQGLISGMNLKSIYDENYIGFEGIPFGKPPIGELRFKEPQPAEGWSGIRQCIQAGSPPVQMDWHTNVVLGSEDCLYLNVYTKCLNTQHKLPVMVWIYGGSFVSGYADREKINPDYFMWKNVVLVTFNYRLGPLGFLSLKDPSLKVPGNAGLKDMVLALKWVKANIECFNGDQNNITLFGESAGGAAVHYMMISRQADGLFHKAIMQSGCMLNPWASIKENNAFRLAEIQGYNGSVNNEAHILQFLQKSEYKKLVSHPVVNDNDRDKGMLYAFAPVIEPYDSAQCILSVPIEEAIRRAWGNKIPLIIGGTSFEGIVVYARFKQQPWKAELFFKDPQALLPLSALSSSTPQDIKVMTRNLLQMHLGDDELGEHSILKLLDVFSIRYFWLGFYQTVLFRLTFADAPTYFYRFDFDSKEFGFRRIIYSGGEIQRGVSHADDLQYLFHFREANKLGKNTPEYKTIRRMIGMWYSFAKNSSPCCEEMDDVDWKPVDKDNPFRSLNIGRSLVLQDLPEKEKLLLWNTFC